MVKILSKQNLLLFSIFLENQLIQNLPYENQCDSKQADIVKFIYSTKITKVEFNS